MAQSAKITSVEALAAFRASLILYLSKARPVLEEVSAEVLRTRAWLQNDQRRHWENEARLRKRRLEEAQAELLNARISQFKQGTSLPHMAMQRAKRSLQDAEEKLAIVKHWDRDMENRTDPLTKQMEQLHGFLASDMKKAVAYLEQMISTLDAYAEVRPPAPRTEAASDPDEKGSPA